MIFTPIAESIRATSYSWDYLIPENNNRSSLLAEILGPYIRPGEHVLDMLCGFSPVAKTMIDRGCTIEGFDKREEAINYCRRSYPEGRYAVARDEKFEQLWRDTGGAGAMIFDAQQSVGLGFFCYGLGRTLRPGTTVLLGAIWDSLRPPWR